MMCARLVRHRPASAEPAWSRRAGAWFESLIQFYARGLNWVLDHQGLTLAVAVGTLALTAFLYVVIPKGFFPSQDTGLVQVITEGPQSISYPAMAERQGAVAEAILKDKDVESLSSFVGVDGTNVTLNAGRMLVNLKPRSRRSDTASEVIANLEQETDGVPGISAYFQPVQDLTIDDRVARTQYQFVLESANPDDLVKWTAALAARLGQLPQLSDVATDLAQQGLAAYLTVDRDTAARFGITAATIDNALYDAFGQRIVSTIFTQSNQYRVIMEATPALQKSPESLYQIYVPSAAGTQVPLSAIAKVDVRSEPLLINHLGQFPANTISFNVPPGGSLGDAVKAVRKAEKELGMPDSVLTSFQGAASAFESSLSSELYLLLAAVVTMYIILGVLYESFIHPITILSTLPSAGIGALLALMLVGDNLDVIGIIGIILLIGIVKKNAIMMIDFALDAERNEGLAPREAIYQACLLRFRPILMTTMAALLGAVPLMLGTGTGSELRTPLGLTIVGGLIVSQVLTLFTTPVIYLAFDRIAVRLRERAADVVGTREPAA
jgi:multidrug efflux pump